MILLTLGLGYFALNVAMLALATRTERLDLALHDELTFFDVAGLDEAVAAIELERLLEATNRSWSGATANSMHSR